MNRETLLQLSEKMRAGDVTWMRQILLAHPGSVHEYYAGGSLLHIAAEYDNVDMMQMLVDLGLDVNVPDLTSPEGPIDAAATHNSMKAARWLLKRGAKINFEVNGETRVSALAGASYQGYLDMVKLLIEHGADINAVWGDPPMNSLAFAVMYGKKEVEEYLRLQGAKLPEELQAEKEAEEEAESPRALTRRFRIGGPEEEEAATEDEAPGTPIFEHIRAAWGLPAGTVQEIVPGDPSIKIHHVPALLMVRDHHVLITEGMSNQAMKVPKGGEGYRYAEMVIYLPADWPLRDAKKMAEAKYAWPVEWLRKIARWPHEHKTWLGGECAIIANGEPPQPLAPNVKFTCIMAHQEPGEAGMAILPDGRRVVFYFLTPLYTEERDLEKTQGLVELLRRLHEIRDDATVDIHRPNVALEGSKPAGQPKKKGKKGKKGK